MHTLGDIYGQFMLRLCLWCLGSIAAGVAFCVLASIAKRYAKLVRRVGLFAAILLSTFIFGMIREGAVTQEDKEEYRAAMAPILEERAAIARILLPSDGDLPRADSSLAEMNADPPRSAPETTWQSFDCWNHGIYMGGERVDFEPGWVFPYGSNHLSSVEVMAWGEILANSRSLAPIASLGRRVSLLPDVSSFQYGLTPSNTYTFVWNGARDGRISGEPFDGIIELFRHGDISVTTNGVTEVYPRILPFPHDGFGQDDEWVAANFTNATEILAMGYAAWVDAQVGEGLTNGLYKLTVTVAEDPPEVVNLSIGDSSVAIAAAGEYVFLLGKGVRYPFSASSDIANGFQYSVVDDVPAAALRGSPTRSANQGVAGHWVPDLPRIMLPPMYGYVLFEPFLSVIPSRWTPSEFTPSMTFTAVLSDVAAFAQTPSYLWTSTGSANVQIANANSDTATIYCSFPDSYGKHVGLCIAASFGETAQTAWYSCEVEDFDIGDYDYVQGTGEELPAGLFVGAYPAVVFFEKGTGPNWTSANVACRYATDCSGTFTLTLSGDDCTVTDSACQTVTSGHDWEVDGPVHGVRHFLARRPMCSSSPSGTVFTVTFTPDDDSGLSMTNSTSVVFVEWETETMATWPADRRRKTIGVCEEVLISLNPDVNQRLSHNQANGSSLNRQGFGKWTYIAPSVPSFDSISAQDYGELFPFAIVAPSGYESRLVSIMKDPTQGVSGAFRMSFNLTLLPTNVSFYALQVIEVGLPANECSGYFSDPRNSYFREHTSSAGANQWVDVLPRNQGTDYAQIAELPPPWGDGGSMTWPIPNKYRSKAAPAIDYYFCNTDQSFSVASNGTATQTKFDWMVTAGTNRVFNIERVSP